MLFSGNDVIMHQKRTKLPLWQESASIIYLCYTAMKSFLFSFTLLYLHHLTSTSFQLKSTFWRAGIFGRWWTYSRDSLSSRCNLPTSTCGIITIARATGMSPFVVVIYRRTNNNAKFRLSQSQWSGSWEIVNEYLVTIFQNISRKCLLF